MVRFLRPLPTGPGLAPLTRNSPFKQPNKNVTAIERRPSEGYNATFTKKQHTQEYRCRLVSKGWVVQESKGSCVLARERPQLHFGYFSATQQIPTSGSDIEEHSWLLVMTVCEWPRQNPLKRETHHQVDNFVISLWHAKSASYFLSGVFLYYMCVCV